MDIHHIINTTEYLKIGTTPSLQNSLMQTLNWKKGQEGRSLPSTPSVAFIIFVWRPEEVITLPVFVCVCVVLTGFYSFKK